MTSLILQSSFLSLCVFLPWYWSSFVQGFPAGQGWSCWAQLQLVWMHRHSLLWCSEAPVQAVLQCGLKAAFLEISLLDHSPNVSDGIFWKILDIIFDRKGSCSVSHVSLAPWESSLENEPCCASLLEWCHLEPYLWILDMFLLLERVLLLIQMHCWVF